MKKIMKIMKMIFWANILLMLFQSCYGVNEKTSEIYNLNTTCLSKDAWVEINKEHSNDRVIDSTWKEKLEEFKDQPFPVEVLYFNDTPQELIGIAANHYSVRYVYNPQISNQILDGLSPQLKDKDKKRIGKRIQTLLMKYQCENGRNESLKLIEKE